MKNVITEEENFLSKYEKHYSNEYFDSWVEDSISSAERLLAPLFDLYKPESVADFGCGRGAWLAACEKMGAKKLHGYDGEWVDKKKLRSEKIEFFPVNFDKEYLTKSQYDLAISVEVAEHVSESAANGFVRILVGASPVIVFGAAAKGQGGENHINEQWQSYWINKFKENNYECFDFFRPLLWEDEKVDWWYRQNTFLFIKKDFLTKNILKLEKILEKEQKIYNIVHPKSFEYRLKMIKDLEQLVKIKEDEIKFLQSSKFWKLRDKYLKLRKYVTGR